MPLAKLRPNEKNPRSIKDGRFAELKRALSEDPEMLQARPVIALPDGTVIAGNMRLRAAEALGWEDIPTVVVELDSQRAQLWALRDNAAYGEWVEQDLAEMLFGLGQEGADLGLTGLDEKELTRLLDSVGGNGMGQADPDGVPDTPETPETETGQVWQLGDHRLLCGDALHSSVLKGFYDGVSAVITDPPYGIRLDTDYSSMESKIINDGRGKTYRPVVGDSERFDASLLRGFFGGVKEQFWFGADYYRRSLSADDQEGSWLVWDKRSESADAGFGSGFELIWSAQRHKRDLLRVYWFGVFGPVEAKNRVHPTQKPVELLRLIFERWTQEGDIVADPFLGSGSTLIAAEKTGRICHGVEIDPRYCDVAVQRWEEFTGQKAERA